MNKHAHAHLVVDIGNTNIVVGVYKNRDLNHRWRLNTKKEITVDEVILTLQGLLATGSLQLSDIAHIALASVVPSVQFQWTRALEKIFSITPLVMEAGKCSSFKIDYHHPEQIGSDRLCNVLACQALEIPEAVVIDFGTATTFDIYSENTYWGGVICPGIVASMKELAAKASRLSEVELFWNTRCIGKNTDDALRNGVLFGTLGQIDYIVKRILEEVPMHNPAIIATGGMAGLIEKKSPLIQRVEKNLTLLGLEYFIELNKEREI